ncbi:hypothetical protein GCM10007973_12570 [Polymorphobacter multimanifer]|uniref:HEAT repeat domain-containing protein n=1 Tax=Polymorphobacter multimanifer TaxID=1070431 RepID=A0A841LGW1_9SPHN|nr:HEAT repeat domain-containing protein [Polymorphobacter multimanifer]MBB6229035.1 hypothetical protein [Polymorphobacter multimanifer]GGI77157.1 hypothetical protein GCM10007973_12570 [Polymorphobacter multimanifer]
MRNGSDWQTMLRDADYEAEVVAKARALGVHHRDASGIAALEKQVAALGDDAAASFEAVEDFFTLSRVREVLAAERAAFADTRTFASKFQGFSTSSQTAMAVARARNFITLLVAIDPHMLKIGKQRRPGDKRSVSFSGTPFSMKLLRGTLPVRRWVLTPCDDTTDLGAVGRMASPAMPEVMVAGETIRLGSFETVEYLAGGTAALLLITQMSNGEAPVALTCDADSGEVRSTQAVGQAPSRLQMLASVARMFDRDDAWDAVRGLLDHPLHFVRWHALRELIGMDAGRALPDILRLMESDPQPAVRRGAGTALAMVNAHLAKAA